MSKSISGISEHLHSKDFCWDGEMAQWVTCLQCEHEDQGLGPQHPDKCWARRHGDLPVLLVSGRQRQIPEHTD